LKLKLAVAFLLATLTAWLIPPAKTVASQKQTLPVAIQITTPTNETAPTIPNAPRPKPAVSMPARTGVQPSGRHSTKAEKTIPVQSLQLYLQSKGSPLAPYAGQILQSPYWSTIIGICTIEQYGCTHAPYNNYWGIGPGKKFASLPDGIEAISNLLQKYENDKKHTTIESLNGYYVVPASASWYNTVLITKLKLESLTLQ
jgi:hypothetical protein